MEHEHCWLTRTPAVYPSTGLVVIFIPIGPDEMTLLLPHFTDVEIPV